MGRVCQPYADQSAQRWDEGEGGPRGLDVAEPSHPHPRRAHQLPRSRGPGRARPSHQRIQGRCPHHQPQQGVLRWRRHREVDYEGGYLRVEGESKLDEKEEQQDKNKAMEDVYDGAGNKIDLKAQQELSAKDTKKKIKDIEKKIKDNKKKKMLTDDEAWELEDQLAALKESLAK